MNKEDKKSLDLVLNEMKTILDKRPLNIAMIALGMAFSGSLCQAIQAAAPDKKEFILEAAIETIRNSVEMNKYEH